MLSTLKELDRLYCKIEGELSGSSTPGKNDAAAICDAVTRSRQLLALLEQASGRLSESAADWSQRGDSIPRDEREQVRRLADSARVKASRLLGCCGALTHRLETSLVGLERELGHVRNGARFLRSSRPAKTNYPKFIDSHS
jgi:hypothetical protein